MLSYCRAADAGTTFPAGIAGVVTIGVASLANAGMVTAGVTDLVDAGMAFPAETGGVVTVGVASQADAGMVTVGVTDLADAGAASLADAGMAFLTEPAGVVTVGVVSLANAGMVTVGVADSADAGIVTLAAPVDIPDRPEYGRSVVSCGDRVSPGVWCMERAWIQSDLDCQCIVRAVPRSTWAVLCRPTDVPAHS